MRESLDLQNIVQRLQTDEARKRDLVVPSQCMEMLGGRLVINDVPGMDEGVRKLIAGTGVAMPGSEGKKLILSPTEACHGQIAEKLKVPKLYYDRMREEKHLPLLDRNIDWWLQNAQKNWFVRSFVPPEDGGVGIARAMLSDSFKVIDHLDVAMTVLETLKEMGQGPDKIRIEGDVTDRRMYLRFISQKVFRQTRLARNRPGNHEWADMHAGMVVGNSETGYGRFFLMPRLELSICSNGMIYWKEGTASIHLGSRMDEGVIQWSQETKRKELELIQAQVRDATQQFLSPTYLETKVDELEGFASHRLDYPIDAVTNVCREFKVSDEKTKGILDYFVKSGDVTAFGLSQAVTYFAHEQENADEHYELELVGSKVLERIGEFDKEAKK